MKNALETHRYFSQCLKTSILSRKKRYEKKNINSFYKWWAIANVNPYQSIGSFVKSTLSAVLNLKYNFY